MPSPKSHPETAPDSVGLDQTTAAQAFAALGSEQRLAMLQLLVRAGPDGLAVGEIQSRLGVAASTLSHHIKFLTAAQLMTQERRARSLICRAAFTRVTALAEFLLNECCAEQRNDPRADAEASPEARQEQNP